MRGSAFLVAALACSMASPCLAYEGAPGPAQIDSGAGASALQAIQSQIQSLKAEYEKRIKDLEEQVAALQVQMLRGAAEAAPATAVQAAPPPVPIIPGALNPAMTVVGSFLGRGDNQKIYNDDGARIDNKMTLRETELDLRAAVDPYADGVFIASLASETPGQYSAGVEEAYVTIKKLPFQAQAPLGLKLKVGRFRPSFGNNNILHIHDLPQSTRPLPVQEFLGEEGFAQSGVSGNFFIPTPWDRQSSLDATLQVITGGDVALSPDINARTAYLGHLRWFRSFGSSQNLEIGWSSYAHPAGNGVSQADFHGADFTYRWKPLRLGGWKSFLVSGEFMFARHAYPEVPPAFDAGQDPNAGASGEKNPLGFTVFGQWQFNRRLYAGARWDRTNALNDPLLLRRSFTPYFSYYFSEFLRFRLNYERRWSDLASENHRSSVFAELNFVFGSHPPEPFWVNK
ncbi:MAG: hypothetical protein H6Q05_1472 [Acidobacteria bacterium]|nr:hypothetical protein [Acidobacteriota bacterium]